MAEDEDRRPPIDLFKAIFEDTDSSDESSDNEGPDKAAVEISSDPVVPMEESVEPFQGHPEIPRPTASIKAETGWTYCNNANCVYCISQPTLSAFTG